MSPPAPDRVDNHTSRREGWAILAATLAGAVLRLWSPGRLGLQHFDEGIYALAGLWMSTREGLAGLDPSVVSYAPVAYPLLVGIAYLLTGVGDHAAILPAQLAGIAAIPAIGWLGRRTFGPGAGAASAVLLALAGPHVAFSRMALTDSLFLLAWLLAIGQGMRFLERPGWLRAIGLGLAVGLAQNVKYNGGLAGLIIAATALLCLADRRPDRRRVVIRALSFGLFAAALAALLYLPWYRFVEAHGGYSALMAHHRRYLGGLEGWPGSARLQIAQAVALSGQLSGPIGWGGIAWPLAMIGAAWTRHGGRLVAPGGGLRGLGRLVLILGCGAAVLGLLPESPWWLALASLPWLLSDPSPAVRVIGVWWLAMSVLTPFYHPYARLALPLQAAGWLVAAGLAARLSSAPVDVPDFDRRRRLALAVGLAAAIGFRVSVIGGVRPWPGLLTPSDSLRVAIEAIDARVDAASSPPSGFRAFARPATLYYLERVALRRTTHVLRPLGLLKPGDPLAWFVVDSVLIDQDPEGPAAVAEFAARRGEPEVFPYDASVPARLDLRPEDALLPVPSGHESDRASSRLTIYPPKP